MLTVALKEFIAKDLGNYVLKDKAMVEGLKRYIKYGKKIFLLTNSEYHYTKCSIRVLPLLLLCKRVKVGGYV